jgi:hypothetical protein
MYYVLASITIIALVFVTVYKVRALKPKAKSKLIRVQTLVKVQSVIHYPDGRIVSVFEEKPYDVLSRNKAQVGAILGYYNSLIAKGEKITVDEAAAKWVALHSASFIETKHIIT